ncbi:MAG: phenylalanine--tRNA ligase subunit beta [Armatimonadetes bacterium]|nr:phenylalanine--tRNA ligase subunit beta [Armatimonadota bacterium]
MRVPIDWLREFVEFDLPTAKVAERLTMVGLEVERVLELPEGETLAIYVTPNRGDCLSIYGIAREVAASLGSECRTTELFERARTGFGSSAQATTASNEKASIQIDDPKLCPRYSALAVSGIRNGASDSLIQRRLIAAGMRPISKVVDVTNYVMLELGQPLHAFDLSKLPGGRIVVRQAQSGERIRTLDDVERRLAPPMLAICDESRPIAVAGVMGGGDTEVGPGTTEILLESAHFDASSVRKTSKALNLSTEASQRFERFVDPTLTVAALLRTVELIGGEATIPLLDANSAHLGARSLSVRLSRASLLLGFEVDKDEAEGALERLQLSPTWKSDRFEVQIPTFRPDLAREEDLVEEIGRIVGYERIPEAPIVGSATQGRDSEVGQFAERLRGLFVSAGLQEVVTHTLQKPSPLSEPNQIELHNAQSEELSAIRSSLLPGLTGVLSHNIRHGTVSAALFEIGRTGTVRDGYDERMKVGVLMSGDVAPVSWRGKPREIDYFDLKGAIDSALAGIGAKAEYAKSPDRRFHPGRQASILLGEEAIGTMGELHPDLARAMEFRRRIYMAELDFDALHRAANLHAKFRSLPKYPPVLRDVAFVVEESAPYVEIEQALVEAAGDLLESAELFDRYAGKGIPEGSHSLAFSLTFRSPERSLTDEEANAAMERIVSMLGQRFGAQIRS